MLLCLCRADVTTGDPGQRDKLVVIIWSCYPRLDHLVRYSLLLNKMKVVRQSKYRHLFGTVGQSDEQYRGIRLGTGISPESNVLKANPTYFACPWFINGTLASSLKPLLTVIMFFAYAHYCYFFYFFLIRSSSTKLIRMVDRRCCAGCAFDPEERNC